jgi:hypothetical protein
MSLLSLLQDSIWVAGFALPNRDLHPARNAKLLGAPLITLHLQYHRAYFLKWLSGIRHIIMIFNFGIYNRKLIFANAIPSYPF